MSSDTSKGLQTSWWMTCLAMSAILMFTLPQSSSAGALAQSDECSPPTKTECGRQGFIKYTAAKCIEDKRCCWNKASIPNCYYKKTAKLPGPECIQDPAIRVDCGDTSTIAQECLDKGCCWNVTAVGKWCYYPVWSSTVAVTTTEPTTTPTSTTTATTATTTTTTTSTTTTTTAAKQTTEPKPASETLSPSTVETSQPTPKTTPKTATDGSPPLKPEIVQPTEKAIENVTEAPRPSTSKTTQPTQQTAENEASEASSLSTSDIVSSTQQAIENSATETPSPSTTEITQSTQQENENEGTKDSSPTTGEIVPLTRQDIETGSTEESSTSTTEIVQSTQQEPENGGTENSSPTTLEIVQTTRPDVENEATTEVFSSSAPRTSWSTQEATENGAEDTTSSPLTTQKIQIPTRSKPILGLNQRCRCRLQGDPTIEGFEKEKSIVKGTQEVTLVCAEELSVKAEIQKEDDSGVSYIESVTLDNGKSSATLRRSGITTTGDTSDFVFVSNSTELQKVILASNRLSVQSVYDDFSTTVDVEVQRSSRFSNDCGGQCGKCN